MQELRSTDILDKEIQADARKKAEKILKKADQDCQKILASVDANVATTKAAKEQAYEKRLTDFEADQKASIPLQKECFEVSFIQNALTEKINKYLAGLTEAQRIEIAVKHFDFESLPEDKKFTAYVYGFSAAEAKKVLTKKLGKRLGDCKETLFRKIALEEELGLAKPEGIILESEDKALRLRLTLNQALAQILDKNRAELSDALFGGQK